MKKVIDSFLKSNRWKHFVICFIGALIFGLGFAIGSGLALEFKDKQYGNKFDIIDLLYSILGGVLAVLLKYAVIWII